MKYLSILGSAKPVAPLAENNSWLEYRPYGTAMVFVHGVLSSARECWFNAKTGAFWPALVKADNTFARASVYLGGYHTEVDAGEYGMRDCAKELLDSLGRTVGGHPAVLDHERLVFVCHSLGGVVTRYMLECWREIFEGKAILLVLIASPSIGSQWANSLEGVIDLFQNRTGRELRWKSDSLDDLDRRFKDMRQLQLIPRLTGCEWCEQRFPKMPGFSRLRPIVAVDSASRGYFGDYHLIQGSDHMSIVKPADGNDTVHGLLQNAYQRFDKTYPEVLPAPSPPEAPGAAAPPDLFQCERMSYSIRIYDDGDGHNQFSYEGIRAVRSADGTVFHLPKQWTESGRTTDYVLQYGSSAGVTLGADKTSALFDPAPTAEQPQTLLVESLDAHSYAMDREELAESANAPQRDLDYAQISVRWETVDCLFFQVSFPDAMSLADEPPFVRAYQIVSAGGQPREVFDSALTVAAGQQFFYSPLLRTAVLSVRRPPQHSGYRILWRLGKPAVSAAPGTASEMARLAVRRAALLAIRDCFAATASGDSAVARKARIVALVTTIGGEVAKLLRQTVAKTEADAAALLDLLPHVEITMMAMEGKALRFVAGTAVADPPFWNVRLPLGEGIAGRAARLLDARTYDDEEAAGTVFAGVYLELEPGKRHAWLLAIPLWSEDCGRAAIGVLNVGIFDRSRAYMLKVLGEPAQVRELAAWANGELLPKLLGVVSSN